MRSASWSEIQGVLDPLGNMQLMDGVKEIPGEIVMSSNKLVGEAWLTPKILSEKLI